MIDCGEGTQIRMRQMGLKINRLGHIFISHLHGDHCFGLIGLISSLGMLNRTADMYIHGPVGIQALFQSQLDFFCNELPFKIIFEEFNPAKHEVVYEDRSLTVSTIPLKHRVPCAGFLFQEKPKSRHIKRDMIDFYQIPIAYINRIKNGEDYITEEGETIANELLTLPAERSVSYAYCSDTAYDEKIVPFIKEVDLLYHEATFAEEEILRARLTLHSTASQAAKIASLANVRQLVIGHFSARYSNHLVLLKEAKQHFETTVLASDMTEILIETK